jgi:hypothetical protein
MGLPFSSLNSLAFVESQIVQRQRKWESGEAFFSGELVTLRLDRE